MTRGHTCPGPKWTTSNRLNRLLIRRDTAGRDVTTRRLLQRHRGGSPPATPPSRRRNRIAIARTATGQAVTTHQRFTSPVTVANTASPDDSLQTLHRPTPWSTTTTLTAAMVGRRPSMRRSLRRTRSGMGLVRSLPAMAVATHHQWPRPSRAMSTRIRRKL